MSDIAALALNGITAIDRQAGKRDDPCPVCGEPRADGIQIRVCCASDDTDQPRPTAPEGGIDQ